MTKETWEIERMRAWTALVAAALTKTESASWSLTLGDNLHEEWEKRFPEPKEDKSKEPLIEQLKKKWFYSGKWHDAECACILHDQGNCNCKPFDIESIL